MTSTDETAPGAGDARDPHARVTGGDGQEYTVEELRERVTLAAPGVIVIKEIRVGSIDALTVMLERVRELAAGRGEFGIVVDLIDSHGMVPGDYRRAIPRMLNMVGAKHVGIALYANPVVRAASKFIANRIGLNVTVYGKSEEAVAAILSLLGGDRPS